MWKKERKKEFVAIQKSGRKEWGQGAYGYVSFELFVDIQGVTFAELMPWYWVNFVYSGYQTWILYFPNQI